MTETADKRLHRIAAQLAVYQYMNPHYKLDDIVSYFKDKILSFTCKEIELYKENRRDG